MAYLFNIVGNSVKPSTESLLVSPFKDIWERDQCSNKSVAVKEFTFIEFMASIKNTNPYIGYSTEERRQKLVFDLFENKRKDLLEKGDELIENGINFIDNLQYEGLPTYRYYIACLDATNKIRDFFTKFNMEERNKSGMPVYKAGDITKALNDTDKILSNMTSMRKKIDNELYDMQRARADKKINYFER